MKRTIGAILFFVLMMCCVGISCKKPITEKDEVFIYTLEKDGSYSIGMWNTDCDIEIVEIPLSFKGKYVTSITERGFIDCKNIKRVVLTSKIVRIAAGAFWGCDNLEEIYIPLSCKGLGNGIFHRCINLRLIVYEGSKKQWGNILKGSSWEGDCGNYTIECNDGRIRK